MSVPTNPLTVDSSFCQFAPEIRRYLLNRVGDADVVDDILQSTFLKLNHHFESINPTAVRAWLYRVAINEANMFGRRKKVETKAWNRLKESRSLQTESTETSVLRNERIEQMRLLLDKLPENQKTIVRLKFYQGLTFAEIATRLETPLGTVLSRMRTAMKSLEKYCERVNLGEP